LPTFCFPQSKNVELENENRRLNQQCSVDKRALVKLREELVEEKLKCDNLLQQLDTVGKKMSALGIDMAAIDSDDNDLISHEYEKWRWSNFKNNFSPNLCTGKTTLY
jgi:hypothetical protein